MIFWWELGLWRAGLSRRREPCPQNRARKSKRRRNTLDSSSLLLSSKSTSHWPDVQVPDAKASRKHGLCDLQPSRERVGCKMSGTQCVRLLSPSRDYRVGLTSWSPSEQNTEVRVLHIMSPCIVIIPCTLVSFIRLWAQQQQQPNFYPNT